MRKFRIKKPGAAFLGIAAIGLALSITAMSLNIRQVTVSGNNRYTQEQLTDIIFRTKADRNWLYCYGKDRFGEHLQIPFVEDYRLVFHSPFEVEVIVHEKSSLAPPGQSLAFSLGDEKGFRWIGAYDISAEDLLAGGEGSKTELKQEQAVKLIEEFLSAGRKVSIAEINKEASERGISERTVRLARNSMGDKIASERQGKDWWIWFK